MSEKTNIRYKDALFKIVFGENPANALSLYNAINNTDYTNVDDLEITTLRDGVCIGIRNDVSFLFNHDLNLYEHQSTFCPNMPLRGLGYFAELYKLHLGGGDTSIEMMYDRRLLKIPAPKYCVFYNGRKDEAEQTELRLSSAYDGDGDIEVVAHMINVNKGFNEDLMRHCKPMADYSEFVYRVRERLRRGLSKEDAIGEAIEDCIRDGILTELLKKERGRVENILIRGLTEEEREHLHEMQLKRELEEGRAEGREEGRAEGREEGRAEGREEGRAEGREEGRAEGREEGRAEGREEGRAEGREEGRAEGREEERDEMIRVASYLESEGRNSDILRAITDEEFRTEILSEMSK